MLKIETLINKPLLNELSQKIFKKDFDSSVGFALYFEEKPIGLAKIKVDENLSHLIFIGISEDFRKKGFGDFFTRSLLNSLSAVSEKIGISYKSDYFLKFGFTENGNEMIINSENLHFPRKCKGEC